MDLNLIRDGYLIKPGLSNAFVCLARRKQDAQVSPHVANTLLPKTFL